MGDMGDIFNEMREASQKRRASNRENSAEILTRARIPFESKNDGAHLIVDGRIDFWPGTGLWIVRGRKQKRRGVRRLIIYVRSK